MGLRDFMLGMNQFRDGMKGYAEGQQASDQRTIRDQFLNTDSKNLLSQFQSEKDPGKKASLAGQYSSGAIKAGVAKEDPYAEAMAKYFTEANGMGKKKNPYTVEELKMINKDLGSAEVQSLSGMERDAQDKTLHDRETRFKDQNLWGRQGKAIDEREGARQVNYKKDFNKNLQDAEVKFDDAVKGLQNSLAQFKKNPNKSSLQQLAVSMARAGGDTGVLSNQDMGAYKLNTVSQDLAGLESYITNSPENTITPEVQKALADMAEFGIQNAEARKTGRLKTLATNEYGVYGDKLHQGGKKDPTLLNWEKRLGIQFGRTPEGAPSITKQRKSYTGDAASVANEIGQLKDEKMKEKFLDALDYGDPTPDRIQAIREKLKKVSGGKP